MVSEQPKGRGGWDMEVQGWLHEGDRQRLTVGVLLLSVTRGGADCGIWSDGIW